MDRNIIEIDTSEWRHVIDFYKDVLKNIRAPDWHGKSINALVDSMIYGGINEIESPYTIRFRGVDDLPADIIDELRVAKNTIDAARLDQRNTTGLDADVEFEIA